MNRLTMLVTPDGQWVFPETNEFYEVLGDPSPDYDAELFAVKNLGFVKFSMIERAIVEIELHPRTVAMAALLAVQQQIQTSGVSLFRIKYLTTTWHSEITSSAKQAMVRLSELCAPEFVAPARDKYVVEERDYTQLLNDETNPLRFMAQKWRMSFGKFDSTVISFAISHQMLAQLLIVGIRPGSDPVWRFVGEAHSTWLDRRHHLTVIGDRVDNVPDKEYGCWAAEFYKNVALTGQPRFDCVTANIQSQDGPYRTRYERLMLPWRTTSEEVLLTVSPRRLVKEPASVESSESSPLARKFAKSS